MRDSTIIYRSFYEAIKELPKESQAILWEAICEYCFNGKEVNLTGINKTVFILIKPQLEANNKRYENGQKGGRPKGVDKPSGNQTVTKPEPNKNDKPSGNQTVTKPEPNKNDNPNGNDNKNKNDNPKEEKEKYLEHILLTEREHQKLLDWLGKDTLKEYMEKVNNYVGMSGRKYKSHYHAIRQFVFTDFPDGPPPKRVYLT